MRDCSDLAATVTVPTCQLCLGFNVSVTQNQTISDLIPVRDMRLRAIVAFNEIKGVSKTIPPIALETT